MVFRGFLAPLSRVPLILILGACTRAPVAETTPPASRGPTAPATATATPSSKLPAVLDGCDVTPQDGGLFFTCPGDLVADISEHAGTPEILLEARAAGIRSMGDATLEWFRLPVLGISRPALKTRVSTADGQTLNAVMIAMPINDTHSRAMGCGSRGGAGFPTRCMSIFETFVFGIPEVAIAKAQSPPTFAGEPILVPPHCTVNYSLADRGRLDCDGVLMMWWQVDPRLSEQELLVQMETLASDIQKMPCRLGGLPTVCTRLRDPNGSIVTVATAKVGEAFHSILCSAPGPLMPQPCDAFISLDPSTESEP